MLDVGIKETTATTGAGAITLSAVAGFVRVSDAFGVGDPVGYCLISGNGDKEWGLGRVAAGNTLERVVTTATLVGAAYTTTGATPISLTGTSEVIVTEHVAAPAIAVPSVKVDGISSYVSPILTVNTAGGTLALTANRLYAIPFIAPVYTDNLAGMGLVVTTLSAGTAYLGVAESARGASGWRPGRVIGQGSVDVGSSGIKTDTASYAPRLLPGHLYWLLLTCTSTPTIRAIAVGGQRPIMGLSADGIPPYSWLYASQAGPIPGDVSAASFVQATAGSATPHIFFAP